MAFSQPTRNALARVAAGETPYAAAKAEGIALTTVYNAVKKVNEGLLDHEKTFIEPKKMVMSRAVATVNLTPSEMQRCQEASDKLKISRYRFFQLAITEKTDSVLNSQESTED